MWPNDELVQHQCLLNFKRDMMFGTTAIGNFIISSLTELISFNFMYHVELSFERTGYECNPFALFCKNCAIPIFRAYFGLSYSYVRYYAVQINEK